MNLHNTMQLSMQAENCCTQYSDAFLWQQKIRKGLKCIKALYKNNASNNIFFKKVILLLSKS